VYLTGEVKSSAVPEGGETVAPDDTAIVGVNLVTSVPGVTVKVTVLLVLLIEPVAAGLVKLNDVIWVAAEVDVEVEFPPP
jgi:hypothetical protein